MDDEISEEGRQARFAQWERVGLDSVREDLATGGYRLTGGPPQVRALAREWVRMKEAERLHMVTQALGLSTNSALDVFGVQRETELDRLVNVANRLPGSVKCAAPNTATTTEKPPELLTLKLAMYGIGIDLKEVGRRFRRQVQKWRGRSE